jgi:hypothetical protein
MSSAPGNATYPRVLREPVCRDGRQWAGGVPQGGYPVLYLGKPTDSVVVEAYRHLIDPVVVSGGAVPPIRPRVLITCEVSATNILDLRSAATLALSGLTLKQLQSDTSDKAAYAACQNISAAAHQLEFHGPLAPAATKLGETLVLFPDIIPPDEHQWARPKSCGSCCHLILDPHSARTVPVRCG